MKHRKAVRLAIVIPTYNEAKNIGRLLNQLKQTGSSYPFLTLQVFIVDDSSPDGTAHLAQTEAAKLRAADFEINVLQRKNKDGLGRAYVHGFKYVLAHHPSVKYILQMDADFSHDPAYIPAFVELAESQELDLAIGSRYIKGGGIPDWTWSRKALSRGGNLYARFLLGKRITDYTGGYNMYTSAILRRLGIEQLQSDGYSFQIELKYRTLQATAKVAELPIVFKDRSLGISKIPRDTARKTVLLVLRLRLAG